MFLLRSLPVAGLVAGLYASALPAQTPDSSILTPERIFASPEFAPERPGSLRGLRGEAAYTRLEPDSALAAAMDVVRYDAASGGRQIWVSAARLVPSGDS
ncbi:MAG TPA: hypothetical protein VF046_09555, partial [Gemmatimonadales bacterium]